MIKRVGNAEKAVIIGNLTHDNNEVLHTGEKYEGIGGPPFFCSKILRKLEVAVTIWSQTGSDFPSGKLNEITLLPESPVGRTTLIFQNIYHPDGSRRQKVILGDSSGIPPISGMDKILRERQDLVIVAPVLNNITKEELKEARSLFPNALAVYEPQGTFRIVDQDGRVRMREWSEAEKVIPHFDLIILSEKDGFDLHPKAREWSKSGTPIILTQEAAGCTIYQNGESFHIPAFNIENIIDATGAGDIFAAAFSWAYRITGDLRESARFANAAAGMSLRYLPNKIEYAYEDIIELALRQGVNINII